MEHKLIDRMQHFLGEQKAPWDDCAVLPPWDSSLDQLVTSDMLMDGVHFLVREQSLSQIGYKALAVNISDIAAMAGTPQQAFVSLALPRDLATEAAIDELYQGIARCADLFAVALAGGDTNIWQGPLVISITALGRAHKKGAMLRGGARPGDRVLVTGPLGGSLINGRHLTFRPRVIEAQWLAEQATLRGMADISDGLATDLRHIMSLSGVGITLRGEDIPIHDDVAATDEWSRVCAALTDGEDFELVFCCHEDEAKALTTATDGPATCYEIGYCTDEHADLRVTWQGQSRLFNQYGYRHK